MRTVFEILPSSFEEEKCVLLCEVSNEGFSFCIKEEETNLFLGVAIYHYDKSKPAVGFAIDLQIIFHQKEILAKKFKKVCVVFSNPESVLVPSSIYQKEKCAGILNLMCGDLNDQELIFTDLINGQQLYNCYRIPGPTYEMVQDQFPQSKSVHQYSMLLSNPSLADNQMSVIFNSQKIIVSLIKDNKYQLVNSFNYEAPEDVSYILLNICHQFDLPGIPLKLHGLIEEKSSLYNEIFKYFEKIEFASYPDGSHFSEEILKYPAHYFSYLFAIAECE